MCGLAGYISKKMFDHSDVLIKMGQAIAHRGPDDVGIWFDKSTGIALCHRRLSIIDLSPAGHQPMLSHNNNFVVAFNGEIYNYELLRQEINNEEGEIQWNGHSDTEVILAGIECWGIEKTLQKLTGMFAIAIWSKDTNELVLARDRIGEKPLYYGWHNNVFLFGSELKAIMKHPQFNGSIDKNALASFFKYNYVPGPLSIYKDIFKLEPGSYLSVNLEDQEPKIKKYWDLYNYTNPGSFKGDSLDATKELDLLLKDAVGKQMIADVPLGAFLSGGVDSSTIVALMQSQSQSAVKTFTIGFDNKGFDEAVYAKKIANHLQTDHTELYVQPKDTLDVIPKLSKIYDEPFSDSSQIPTYLVAQLAKSKVTVSLSGDAGDEIFGGYNRYIVASQTWSKLSKIPMSVRNLISNSIQTIGSDNINALYKYFKFAIPKNYQFSNFGEKMFKSAKLLESDSEIDLYNGFISHWDPSEIIKNYYDHTQYKFKDVSKIDFIEQMMALDTLTYLPDDILVKVDRAAMANSLETRVPFLDHSIIEFAWSLPREMKITNGIGKNILREVLYKYVPKDLIERPKMGFAIPLDSWLRNELREWAEDLLSDESLNKHGLLNNEIIALRWKEHLGGGKNWQHHIWDVLMFQCWFNEYHG